jgi:hypothetical protein
VDDVLTDLRIGRDGLGRRAVERKSIVLGTLFAVSACLTILTATVVLTTSGAIRLTLHQSIRFALCRHLQQAHGLGDGRDDEGFVQRYCGSPLDPRRSRQ